MYLRKLELKDAPLMLEWMHDKSVVEFLGTNFASKTLTDCENFIINSKTDDANLNLAVANEEDEYMGTVSLKHIDKALGFAEFAITVRNSAMGKGYSKFGMQKILEMGIDELGLKTIYWCVSPVNVRAVKFYDKCGYERVTDVPQSITQAYPEPDKFLWYKYSK